MKFNTYKNWFSIFLCGMGLLLFTTSKAQDTENNIDSSKVYQVDRFLSSIGLAYYSPQGFVGNYYNGNLGVNGSFYVRVSKKHPFFVGLHIGYTSFDNFTTFYDLTDEDGFFFPASETSTPHLFTLHSAFRAQPYFNFFLHPYGEIYLGGNHFFTRTVVRDLENSGGDNTIENNGQLGSWALSVGAALGFNVSIFSTDTQGLELDFKCMFLRSGNANFAYLPADEDSNGILNSFDVLELETSTTTFLIPQIGIMYYFGG